MNVSKINNVGELLDALANAPRETPVIGTYEGIQDYVSVYPSADGEIVIDVDQCSYQPKWQRLNCCECGQPARRITDGVAHCFSHYPYGPEEDYD